MVRGTCYAADIYSYTKNRRHNILELLSRHYGSGLLLDYGLPKETGQELIKSGRYKCVHGHFIADKYMSIPNAEYVFWLRNPIQRLYSQFYFGKRISIPTALPGDDSTLKSGPLLILRCHLLPVMNSQNISVS